MAMTIADADKFAEGLTEEEAQADRIIDRITGDKWGPCAAFEIKGTKATEIKRRHGRAGTRDKVFLFVGLASE